MPHSALLDCTGFAGLRPPLTAPAGPSLVASSPTQILREAVISRSATDLVGTSTFLTQDDIRKTGGIPDVSVRRSDAADPQGTVVIGLLEEKIDIDELKEYLRGIVEYVPIGIRFNRDLISRKPFLGKLHRTAVELGSAHYRDSSNNLSVEADFYLVRRRLVICRVRSIVVNGRRLRASGELRFEQGAVDVFNGGFKLCSTRVVSSIGFCGRIECDELNPTAGRDSLDAKSTSLLNSIQLVLEHGAIDRILRHSNCISQYPKIFKKVWSWGWNDRLGEMQVKMAEGPDMTLKEIKEKADSGIKVFYGITKNAALNHTLLTKGHLLIMLSQDHDRQLCEQEYLEQFCGARSFEGVVEIEHVYTDLDRFERIVISQVEVYINQAYEIPNVRIITGKLTDTLPATVRPDFNSATEKERRVQ
jgi:hypothetical protein